VLPNSLLGLALFVALLTPGFVGVLRRERRLPSAQASVFRETVRIVAASEACLVAAGLCIALARLLTPNGTVDVGALTRDPGGYAPAHHVLLAWWALTGLALAVGFAVVGTDHRLTAAIRSVTRLPLLRSVLGGADTDIRPLSGWSKVFTLYDDDPAGPGEVHVTVALTDTSVVTGRLSSHSPSVEDTPDRDLVLAAPIRLRSKDGKEHDLPITHTVISARSIIRLDVTHLAPPSP